MLQEDVLKYFESMSHEELARLAVTDALTGTLKRDVLFVGPASERIVEAAKQGRLNLAMCDLDLFKRINDTYGHPMGDDVLRKAGACLNRAFRLDQLDDDQAAYIIRYGGEEFVVFCIGMECDDFMQRIYNFRDLLRTPISTPLGDADIRPTSSVGVLLDSDAKQVVHHLAERDASGLTSRHYSTVSALIARVDEALYQAKRNGRDNVQVFDPKKMELKLNYNASDHHARPGGDM